MKKILVLGLMPLLLLACKKADDPLVPPTPLPKTSVSAPAASDAAPANPSAAAAARPVAVGADQDEHGCKASAGYQWSALKGKCLRLFEDAIRLNPLEGVEPSTQSAFVLFDEGQLKAELYLPGKAVQMLERQGEEGAQVWAAGIYRLLPWKGYVLQENGKAVYGGQ